MIAPATTQNPARLYPIQIAELRASHGDLVDKLIREGVIVEQKGGQHATASSQN